MSYLSEVLDASRSTLAGLSVTIKEFMQRPITEHYPDVYPEIVGWARGIPVHLTDLGTGEYMCTGCEVCARVCPVECIDIKWHQEPGDRKKFIDQFDIDMSKCMQCGLCVEGCAFNALVMANHFEMAGDSVEGLVYDFPALIEIGLPYSKVEEKVKGPRPSVPYWVFRDRYAPVEEQKATIAKNVAAGHAEKPAAAAQAERPTAAAAPPAERPAAAAAPAVKPSVEAPAATGGATTQAGEGAPARPAPRKLSPEEIERIKAERAALRASGALPPQKSTRPSPSAVSGETIQRLAGPHQADEKPSDAKSQDFAGTEARLQGPTDESKPPEGGDR